MIGKTNATTVMDLPYLPLTGGVLTGSVTVDVDNNDTISMIANDEKSTLAQMQVQAGNASYAALDLYNDINQELTLAARRPNTSLQMNATNTALVKLSRYDTNGSQTASVSMAATASRGVVSGLTTPISKSDAANKEYVDNTVNNSKIWWGEANTDGINITATVGDGFTLKDGVMVRLVMDAVNPQSPNLNVNGTGDHAVISPTINSSGLAFDGMWVNGEIVEFVYYADSNAWVLINRKRATGVRFGWVTTANTKNSLQQTDNPTYQVATANAVAEALDALVATQNFEGSVFTLTAANWSTDNTYNLEVLYPSAKYNLQISISSTATAEQYEAYNAAGIVGDNSTNVLTARNGKPTIDIPVKIQMFVKNWGDM